MNMNSKECIVESLWSFVSLKVFRQANRRIHAGNKQQGKDITLGVERHHSFNWKILMFCLIKSMNPHPLRVSKLLREENNQIYSQNSVQGCTDLNMTKVTLDWFENY